MIRSILVPLDASPFGEAAIPLALEIARRAGATIHLASVHEPVVVTAPARPALLIESVPSAPLVDPAVDAELRAQRGSYLESVGQRLRGESGLEIATTLLDGPVPDSLAAHAAESRTDLIVMATHGRSGLTRVWLGSVAEGVVREAAVPVLLSRPDEQSRGSDASAVRPQRLRHVLLPLDGSALAEAILEPALEVAGDAECTLLTVVEPLVAIAPAGLVGSVALPADDPEQRASSARDYLDSTAAKLRARARVVRTHVLVHTHASRAILDHAREIGADLIAMATHGRGSLRRLFLGSVAEKVLRGAETSVLLYRPHGAR
jgi:nucleotide-binding universal stress UspA family protein